MGYSIDLDEKLLQSVSKRLHAIARQANMPVGEPVRYDYAQYIHQIPGGVISNLRFQLSEIGLSHRLDEVIQECIRIREDLGYPIMITPFSQFVGTQAAINVATAPAPGITNALRQEICQAAVGLARNIRYESAGTCEFIFDEDTSQFYFLEMNTRIQVEHPVSETSTGIDLVQEQFRVAAGERLRFKQSDIQFRGHAIECRINAEIPEQGFRPNAGLIQTWDPPAGPNIRLDTH
jgi:pyruvate carboxylase